MTPVRRWLFGVIALGFVIRIVFAAQTAARPLEQDETTYDTIAWNLVTGHGYVVGHGPGEWRPTALRGPGYVFLVAATYSVFGHRKMPVIWLQVLLDTFCILLVWRIGRRLFGDPALALGGAFLYAIYPPVMITMIQMLTETYTNVTLLLAVERGLAWSASAKHRDLVLSGVATGLCALSKPQFAPVAVLIPLAAIPHLRTARFWRACAAQVAVVTLVLTPWIVRNALTFHAFIPGVTQGGVTFWGGTGPVNGRTVGAVEEAGVPERVRDGVRGLTELERDRWLYREGLRVIAESPGRYARLMLKKLGRLWLNLFYDDPPSRASLAVAAFNLAAIVLWLLMLRTRVVEPAGARLSAWLFAYFSLVHMVMYATMRYAQAFLPVLLSFAGAWIALRLRGRMPPRVAIANKA